MFSIRVWPKLMQRVGRALLSKAAGGDSFHPGSGRRLLVAADAPPGAREALVAGLRALRESRQASSLHITFPDAADRSDLAAAGFLQRKGQQFHFFNRGYKMFDDFLGALASRKRKTMRKERAEALAPGIGIERLTGRDMTEAHWDAFFEFYMDTGSRKWGRPYLTRRFFSKSARRWPTASCWSWRERAGRYDRRARSISSATTRSMAATGARSSITPACISSCAIIRRSNSRSSAASNRVEAGAQGEHKLSRGYEPVPTFSAHDFADPRLAAAAAEYFAREARAVDALIDEYGESGPFRKA